MVTDCKSAGHPVSGGPLFCGRKNRLAFLCTILCLGVLTLGSVQANTKNQPIQQGQRHQQDQKAPISHRDYQCATAALSGNAATERVTVEGVSDGDTLVLSDRRKVRIIGINAAELSKKSERALKKDAEAARDVIKQLISKAAYLTLVAGDETEDNYGRTLAHLLLPDGSSLATELLARGLAAATAIEPNTRCADHYLRIERAARNQNRGIWQHTNNPWLAKGISTNRIQGFHILTRRVKSVKNKRKGWLIKLDNNVMVYAHQHLMDKKYANALIDKTVEIRGWFGRKDGRVSVNLHHLSNLTVQP